MHELVAEELRNSRAHAEPERETEMEKGRWWKDAMEKCFAKMDKEAVASSSGSKAKPLPTLACSCQLQMPRCHNVGSTAAVAVVASRHVVVANCGDSRAVLCRNGLAVPLSSDHKASSYKSSSSICEVIFPLVELVNSFCCNDSFFFIIGLMLSFEIQPDRPDELQRIQAAGGRVIYWDGARVFGVLAMSRAIGT